MSHIIGPVHESLRTVDEPWRIVAIRDDNNLFIRRISDPWLRLEFVNEVADSDRVFQIVSLDEADQLREEEAQEKLARFAAASLKDAFLLVPPDGLDFDVAYKPARIIEAEVVNKSITVE